MNVDFSKVAKYLKELEDEILEGNGNAHFEMWSDGNWFISIKYFGDVLGIINSSWKIENMSAYITDEREERIFKRIQYRINDFGAPF